MTECIQAGRTAAYMTAPRVGWTSSSTFLPSISAMQASYQPYDTFPAPAPLRRSVTTLEWKPSTGYYGTGRSLSSLSHTSSMPEPLSGRNKLNSFNTPAIFSASRNALYTRFTPHDWQTSNQLNFLSSDKIRAAAERVRMDTTRLCREADDKTKRTQSDVGKRLGNRVDDIEYWKGEVQAETDNMLTEIDAMTRAKANLERMLVELEAPLHITQECLYSREKRQGIDLVHDQVERDLIKEVDNIKRCQEDLRRMIQSTMNQQALNRAAQHELEKDAGDKQISFQLDNTCHQLKNTSRGIQYHDGIERVDNTNSVYDTWVKFSADNIRRSQSERGASKELRSNVEVLLNRITAATTNQWNMLNAAFNERMKEYVEARNGIQLHLSKVLQEILDMERNIELIKKCIMEKESPLQVAQTRLVTRIRRPNVEACRDDVQHRLVEEVYEINETVDQLKAQLRSAENALQHLLRTKTTLEHDLTVKNNSIFIDREQCMSQRKTCPLLSRIAVY